MVNLCPLYATGWNDKKCKTIISNCGTSAKVDNAQRARTMRSQSTGLSNSNNENDQEEKLDFTNFLNKLALI